MRELLVAVLVANALFWSLMPHSMHCEFVSNFTDAKCPPHIFHISFGVLSFILAIVLAQKEYFDELANGVKQATQIAGAVLNRASKITSKALKKMPSVNEVADRVEGFVDKVEF